MEIQKIAQQKRQNKLEPKNKASRKHQALEKSRK
jgi:hypothetical protein